MQTRCFKVLFSESVNKTMSSSDDELPDIPGTQFPWMNLDGESREDEVSNKVGSSNAENR